MGYYCTVPQCTSLAGKTKNVKFHRFPKNTELADKWNNLLRRGKPYTKYSKVCSLHFTHSDYNVTTMGQWKTLSKDAMPSQNLPKLNPDGTVMVIRKSRTVKYRDGVKRESDGEKPIDNKWPHASAALQNGVAGPAQEMAASALHDSVLYRTINSISALTNNNNPLTPLHSPPIKKEKQDAIMQTDPLSSEEDDNQLNNTAFSDQSDSPYNQEYPQYSDQTQLPNQLNRSPTQMPQMTGQDNYEIPKDYTKANDPGYPVTKSDYPKADTGYMVQKKTEGYPLGKTNDSGYPVENGEGYKEDEKYLLERAKLQEKIEPFYNKPAQNGYSKDVYTPDYFQEKPQEAYQPRDPYAYQPLYPDAAETLSSQQHALEALQQQHRAGESQDPFIKQETDAGEEDAGRYRERDSSYDHHRPLQHELKVEPDPLAGCDQIMPPQDSPYYQSGHNNISGAYFDQFRQPGPELLIAKQNALAAHQQLWQSSMKRSYFYGETAHYAGSQLLHRYSEQDLTRILQ